MTQDGLNRGHKGFNDWQQYMLLKMEVGQKPIRLSKDCQQHVGFKDGKNIEENKEDGLLAT